MFFSSGYGFDSIAIALLAKNNPFGILAGSFLFGAMRNGADLMELSSGVSKYVISLIQAMVLLFVAAPAMVRWLYRIKTRTPAGRRSAADARDGEAEHELRQARIEQPTRVNCAAPGGSPLLAVGFGAGIACWVLFNLVIGGQCDAPCVISTLAQTVRVATPIALAAFCGVLCERSGVVNIGIEGQMLMAAMVAYAVNLFVCKALKDVDGSVDGGQREPLDGAGRRHAVGAPCLRNAARRGVDQVPGRSDHQRHGDQHPGRGPDRLSVPPVPGAEPTARTGYFPDLRSAGPEQDSDLGPDPVPAEAATST